jgi:di/tricarboxylate transporter
MKPVGMFEITPIGLVIVVIGIAYFMVFGGKLLPNVKGDTTVKADTIRDYHSEVVVMPKSPLIGQSSFDWDLNLIGFRLVRLERAGQEFLPAPELCIEEGDLLLIQGKVTDLLRIKKIEGLEFKASLEPDEVGGRYGDLLVAEMVILPDSDLAGLTLREADLRRTHDLMVLAISRHGQSRLQDMGSIVLRTGDVLLIQSKAEKLDAIRRGSGFAVLDEYEPPTLRWQQGLFTAGVFLVAIIAGSVGWVPLSIAFLCAAVLIVLAGALPGDQVREVIDWRMLILIGGMTAFGTAMEKTGTAAWLAEWVVYALRPMGDLAILGGFFVLTILLTQPMSNAAAALVILPVAMSAATEIGAEPRTFAIGVMLAASISFIAPLEPSCVIVYGPGRYRFMDFVRVGGLLTLILMLVVLPLVPLLWPLR